MDNAHNKSELIHLLSSTFHKHKIIAVQCYNDVKTSIVRVALTDATDDSDEVSIYNYFISPICMHGYDFTGANRSCRFADNANTSLL